MVGRDASVARFNAAAATLLSLTPSDIGLPLRDVKALKDMKDLDDACAYAFKGGASTQHEIRIGDGSSFLVRVLPYMGRGLQIDGAVLTLTNVTSLRASIAQAIREREYAKEIINTVAHPLVVLDAGLIVRTANRAFYAMFQLSRGETEGTRLIGASVWDIPRLQGLLEGVLSKGLPLQNVEIAHEFPRIGHRTMQVNASRLSREKPFPQLILLSIEDISERKRAEEMLRESEEYFRQLTQSLPIVVWTNLPDGRVDFVNQQWLEYAGQSLDDIRAAPQTWMEVLHPDDRKRAGGLYLDSVRAGRGFTMESRLRRASDGAYRWHLSRAVPLRDAAGNIVKFLGSCTDIDDQKRLEAELLETDRRKTEFLAMLAHELRNPLAPIRNALQIMRLTGGDASSIAAIEMMERQVRQLVRLVDDLLDVSRISLGRITLKREHIDLASAVKRAVESVRPLCDGLGQELTVTLPPKPTYLNADRARLAQIVGNLLSNASKFTGKGGRIQLIVETEGKQVVVRVRDSGIGIGPRQLGRIFEMFFQADTPLEQSQGGLGIGLTLVKNFVELHDGTVEAHSQGVGRGSEFVIRLPVLAGPPPPAPETSPHAEQAPTPQMRVLLVEDNRDVADSLALLLELKGHKIHVAREGLEGVEAAAKFRPDVILLDIGLPDVDGYEVARRIRSQTRTSNPVIVALTGWGQAEDRHRSHEAGFDAHLVKPVEPESLMKLIAELGASNKARKAGTAVPRRGSPARLTASRGAVRMTPPRSTAPAVAAGRTDDPKKALAGTWRDIFHDLQGSVAGVAFATSLLEHDDLPESRRHEFVDLLRRGVSYLQEMLNDLMSLARLETGEERPKVAPFDASAMLVDFCAMSQPLIRTRGLFLKTEGPGSLPVEGDRLKIQRILQNLLLHALRCTRHGGVKVVWRGEGRHNGNRWMFCVKETGPLETPESRPDGDSEAAARPRPRTAGQSTSDGISLSIVKRLCEVLDADLDLKSSATGGATFRVSLPRRYDAAAK